MKNRGDASLGGEKTGHLRIREKSSMYLRKLITYLLPDKVRAAKN